MKRIIIGINTDFSDNAYRVPAAYVDCVIAAGGFPLLVPCHENRQALDEYVRMANGFVFIGGYDYPPCSYGMKQGPKVWPLSERRVKADLYLAKAVLARGMPVLGICGGHQLINIALGGKLIQHLSNAKQHDKTKHAVQITAGKVLGRLFGQRKLMVNSNHHQAVMPGALGCGLEPVAFAANGIIEAFEALRHPFLLGLQWHPERMPWHNHASRIFTAFVRAAGK